MTRPFRLTSPVPLERDTHVAVARMLDRLLAPPAFWFCYPAGASVLSAQQAARHSAIGLKRGLPDLWLLHAGAVYCIELKRAGSGRLSKTRIEHTKSGGLRLVIGQEEVFPRLLNAGVREIAICTSPMEVMACLQRWQIPTRSLRTGELPFTTPDPVTLSPSSSTSTTRRRRSARSRSIAT